MIFNIGGYDDYKWHLPEFTYTGAHTLVPESKNGSIQNWYCNFHSSGILTFTKRIEKIDLFIIGAGGAGANTGGVASGGGGYFGTYGDIAVAKGTQYEIIIGLGGTSIGQAGGKTTAFGKTANGGGAAKSGSPSYATVRVYGSTGTAGNVYYYESLSASKESLGNGYINVDLMYPYVTGTHEVGGHTLFRGTNGWYDCTISEVVEVHYNAGTNGTGGASTNLFGNTSYMLVGGQGATAKASRPGQGGGSSVIQGGNGYVSIRNPR